MTSTKCTFIVSIDVGLRTLAISVGSRTKQKLQFHQVDSFDVIQDDTINVAKTSVELLLDIAVFNMEKVLKNLHEGVLRDVEPTNLIFVIESQPTGRFARNVKMKCVSHVLQGLIRLEFGRSCPINFQNAHVKLQACEAVLMEASGPEVDDDAAGPTGPTDPTDLTGPAGPKKRKTKKAVRSEHYRANKKASVQASTTLSTTGLSSTNAYTELLDTSSFAEVWDTVITKKRDDCADALWQLIGYHVFNKPKKSYAVKKKATTTSTAKRRKKDIATADLDDL